MNNRAIKFSGFILVWLSFAFSVLYGIRAGKLEKTIPLKVNKYPFYLLPAKERHPNLSLSALFAGDWKDLEFSDEFEENEQSRETCLRLRYNADAGRKKHGWAEVFLQNHIRHYLFAEWGINFLNARKLFFTAKGKDSGELVEFKMGGLNGQKADSTMGARTGIVKLTNEWRIYELDLAGRDLSCVINSFQVSFSSLLNPGGCTVYIKNIYYYDKNIPHETIAVFDDLYKQKDKIKIGFIDFDKKITSKDYDHLVSLIPEIIKTFFHKQKQFLIIDDRMVRDKLREFSQQMIQPENLGYEAFLKEIRVDYLIKGRIEEVQNNARIIVSVLDVKEDKIITAQTMEGNFEKNMYLWLDELIKIIMDRIKNKKNN